MEESQQLALVPPLPDELYYYIFEYTDVYWHRTLISKEMNRVLENCSVDENCVLILDQVKVTPRNQHATLTKRAFWTTGASVFLDHHERGLEKGLHIYTRRTILPQKSFDELAKSSCTDLPAYNHVTKLAFVGRYWFPIMATVLEQIACRLKRFTLDAMDSVAFDQFVAFCAEYRRRTGRGIFRSVERLIYTVYDDVYADQVTTNQMISFICTEMPTITRLDLRGECADDYNAAWDKLVLPNLQTLFFMTFRTEKRDLANHPRLDPAKVPNLRKLIVNGSCGFSDILAVTNHMTHQITEIDIHFPRGNLLRITTLYKNVQTVRFRLPEVLSTSIILSTEESKKLNVIVPVHVKWCTLIKHEDGTVENLLKEPQETGAPKILERYTRFAKEFYPDANLYFKVISRDVSLEPVIEAAFKAAGRKFEFI